MNPLAWKMRRLRAMTAPEVARRATAMVRDRLAPPAWSRWSAAVAADRLAPAAETAFSPAGPWAQVARAVAAGDCAGTLAAADRLAGGRWTLFGREVALDDPPHWSVDPASGARWPDLPSSRIDYRRTDAGGGAKSVWEAGRLTMLPTLALAARVSGNRVHAERARGWLADFALRNPIGRGIHHTSGIEMAIRTLTIGWTLALLGESTETPESRAGVGLMAQQALWCRDHLSLGSSANNHLLAEYAAMVAAGAGLPRLVDSAALLDAGLAGIEREVPRQIHGDGVTAEQAFRYLPFVWELLLPALALAEAAGRTTPTPVRERLAASLEFARALRRDDGTLPPIGDEDDARVLLADESGSRLDLVGNALAAWLGAPGLTPAAQALALLLTGHGTAGAREAEDGERRFDEGGCTVWRGGHGFATFDHGPLGLGSLAAHGHADALSLTLRFGDDDLVVDPGTLAYHEDEDARSRTRATPFHSTVNFGGRSQSEALGPFLWGRRARVLGEDAGFTCEWWSGERHTRRAHFLPGEIVLEDRVLGPSPQLVFALAAGAQVRIEGRRAQVASGHSILRLDVESAEGWRVDETEVANGFGRREKAARLTARMLERDVRTRLRFGVR